MIADEYPAAAPSHHHAHSQQYHHMQQPQHQQAGPAHAPPEAQAPRVSVRSLHQPVRGSGLYLQEAQECSPVCEPARSSPRRWVHWVLQLDLLRLSKDKYVKKGDQQTHFRLLPHCVQRIDLGKLDEAALRRYRHYYRLVRAGQPWGWVGGACDCVVRWEHVRRGIWRCVSVSSAPA